jgi:hypothetical protein
MTNNNPTTTTAPAKKFRYGWTFVNDKGTQVAPFHSTCIKAHDWAHHNSDPAIVHAYKSGTIHLARIRETLDPVGNAPDPSKPFFRNGITA